MAARDNPVDYRVQPSPLVVPIADPGDENARQVGGIGTPAQAIMKSRGEEDLELVESAQAGNARAFEKLIERYKTRLTRYLFQMLRDEDDTDDVVQDTFIKTYLGLNSFRGDSSFATWLFRIGINTAKRSLSNRFRQGPHMSDFVEEDADGWQFSEAGADFDTPDAKMETREILDLLNAALDGLPEEQRISFELRELEGLTYEEIADQMHCPVGTVRSRIHRARDTLAAALKAH